MDEIRAGDEGDEVSARTMANSQAAWRVDRASDAGEEGGGGAEVTAAATATAQTPHVPTLSLHLNMVYSFLSSEVIRVCMHLDAACISPPPTARWAPSALRWHVLLLASRSVTVAEIQTRSQRQQGCGAVVPFVFAWYLYW